MILKKIFYEKFILFDTSGYKYINKFYKIFNQI